MWWRSFLALACLISALSSVCSSHSCFVTHFVCNFFLQATLTSYSENVERTKYGGESSKELGSGGNLKQWQSQKSSMDSCLYRVDENMSASTYSLNKIPERNLETVLSQSVQSIPLYLMPRPNSVAGKKFVFVRLGQSQTQLTDATALLIQEEISFLESPSLRMTKIVLLFDLLVLNGKFLRGKLFLMVVNGYFSSLLSLFYKLLQQDYGRIYWKRKNKILYCHCNANVLN